MPRHLAAKETPIERIYREVHGEKMPEAVKRILLKPLQVKDQTEALELSPGYLLLKRMIVVMMDTNYISERLASLKQELSDLRVVNARYWSRMEHTPLQKSGRALNQERLVHIKRELSDLMKRCA